MHKYIVEMEDEGTRVDTWLASQSQLSRSKIVQMIKSQKVLVNGEVTKASMLLSVDDEVMMEEYEVKPLDLTPVNMELDIVYEDDDVIVVNKPRGLVVHPGAGTVDPTLVHGLLYHTNQLSSEDPIRPGIVHRIDKDTSGLLVVAKNDDAHQFLAAQLADKTMSRRYLALVHGKFEHLKAKVDAPIGRDAQFRQKMAVTDKNSKHAVTHLTLRESFDQFTLLECALETGRTHQIRVHMQYIGFPIVGDPLYSFKNTPNTQGQLLHAYQLQFVHPKTKEKMQFECPVNEVFEQFLNDLRSL